MSDRTARTRAFALAVPSVGKALDRYNEASAALHELWTAAVGTPGYDKAAWMRLSNAIDSLGRQAATTAGLPSTEPLVRSP